MIFAALAAKQAEFRERWRGNNELLDVESYTLKIKGCASLRLSDPPPPPPPPPPSIAAANTSTAACEAATRRDLGDRTARVLRAMGRGGAGGGVAREPRAHTSAREARTDAGGAEGQPGGQLALARSARRLRPPALPPARRRPPARPLYLFTGDAHPPHWPPLPALVTPARPRLSAGPRQESRRRSQGYGEETATTGAVEATAFEGGHRRRHAVGCRAIGDGRARSRRRRTRRCRRRRRRSRGRRRWPTTSERARLAISKRRRRRR